MREKREDKSEMLTISDACSSELDVTACIDQGRKEV